MSILSNLESDIKFASYFVSTYLASILVMHTVLGNKFSLNPAYAPKCPLNMLQNSTTTVL